MNVGVEDIVVAGVIVCASVAGIITHVLLLIALKVINSYTFSTPPILMKTSQRYYGTSKRHMTFTLLLINSLSQIFYLMSAMPSEGLNAKNIATIMFVTFQTCHQHKLSSISM